MASDPVAEERRLAWLGDAVLSLFLRRWILAESGRMDGALLSELTSNQFLSRFGRPTAVEAGIGRAYEAGGVDAADAWITEHLMPEIVRHVRKKRAG